MPVDLLRSKVKRLRDMCGHALKDDIDLFAPIDHNKSIYDFRESKSAYSKKTIDSSIKEINDFIEELGQLPKENRDEMSRVVELADKLSGLSPKAMIDACDEMLELLSNVKTLKPQAERISIKMPPTIPQEIAKEVQADIEEMERCYNSECYRSAVILCGRILEVCLHRKYYEVTGFDILEKNPGVGLGKLIAKLHEKNVSFDPGLTQQIHLINQCRIFSVHRQQQPFHPSREQAQAMVLYTTDVLKKLF